MSIYVLCKRKKSASIWVRIDKLNIDDLLRSLVRQNIQLNCLKLSRVLPHPFLCMYTYLFTISIVANDWFLRSASESFWGGKNVTLINPSLWPSFLLICFWNTISCESTEVPNNSTHLACISDTIIYTHEAQPSRVDEKIHTLVLIV